MNPSGFYVDPNKAYTDIKTYGYKKKPGNTFSEHIPRFLINYYTHLG